MWNHLALGSITYASATIQVGNIYIIYDKIVSHWTKLRLLLLRENHQLETHEEYEE